MSCSVFSFLFARCFENRLAALTTLHVVMLCRDDAAEIIRPKPNTEAVDGCSRSSSILRQSQPK